MELIERIGSGAYGEVWRARNLATGAARAVKIVFRSTFSDERPFNREFEGIRKFEAISHTHPSQLALFQVGRNDAVGYFYYVMELADSVSASGPYRARTLRGDLEGGRLEAARVLEIALSLTEALAHLHASGLIHRDVKPSNIIFVNGRPKLADIGLVTDASDSRSIVGTEGYLPLEGPGTPAADIFALGKVLYEALTGQDRRQFPQLPTELREWPDAHLVFELNEILLKACAPNARERYSSADAMLADLKLLDAGKSVKRRRSLQRGWAWTWKAAAVMMVFSAAILLTKDRRARPTDGNRLSASSFERSGTTNLEAWKALERGGKLGVHYDASGFQGSIQEYEQAVALDPNYTEAWVRLAMALNLSVEKGLILGPQALQRAVFCSQMALKLDSKNAAALECLATSGLGLDYDFGRAEPLLRKAAELAPRSVSIRHNLAVKLWYYGRFDEAEMIFNQVLRNDPALGAANGNLGLIYASRHRLADAAQSLDTCIRLEPNWPLFRFERAEILWIMDRRTEAMGDWLASVEKDGYPSLSREDAATLNTASRQSRPEQFLLKFIELLERRRAEGKFVSAYDLARLHAHAGNKTRALDYLELAVDEHRLFTLSAKVHIALQVFQNEPRYHAVLRQFKLEK